ncbi:MAG TPA: hypothetical protein PK218_08115 [Flavobacterium sp.]|uniref:hypothetical protein n=1 Tax=Flavobacterium sp. TaxID=239 RepID=UPI002C1BFCBD|nr:hypothetical protein [Flavobacterium sp.]MCA0350125.1 hypothetical protein [Bacteroidota bacterium]HPW98511.1 hypothetical protein [Flavobacterium sp.]HQA73747.1 hypothetical protein [Flavobacterium sp.]
MKKINQTTLLDQKILELTKKRDFELMDLKNQYNIVIESAKPINIIKNSFSSLQDTSLKKETLLELATSFLGGYLSKKILVGKSNNTIKRVIGNVLQYSISTLINKFNNFKHQKNN